MKYVKKLPQTDKDLSLQLLEEGWIKIKEPRNLILAVFLSLPFAFLLGGIVLGLAYTIKPELFSFITSNEMKITFILDLKLLLFLVLIFGYMFLHEMIHAIFIPNFIKSEKTVWGLNGVVGFVSTTEIIKKGRFLLISSMPFIFLSILSMLFLNFIGYLNWYTLSLCLINATGSCVDFLNMILIGLQVKRGHQIINNGFETFYNLAQ